MNATPQTSRTAPQQMPHAWPEFWPDFPPAPLDSWEQHDADEWEDDEFTWDAPSENELVEMFRHAEHIAAGREAQEQAEQTAVLSSTGPPMSEPLTELQVELWTTSLRRAQVGATRLYREALLLTAGELSLEIGDYLCERGFDYDGIAREAKAFGYNPDSWQCDRNRRNRDKRRQMSVNRAMTAVAARAMARKHHKEGPTHEPQQQPTSGVVAHCQCVETTPSHEGGQPRQPSPRRIPETRQEAAAAGVAAADGVETETAPIASGNPASEPANNRQELPETAPHDASTLYCVEWDNGNGDGTTSRTVPLGLWHAEAERIALEREGIVSKPRVILAETAPHKAIGEPPAIEAKPPEPLPPPDYRAQAAALAAEIIAAKPGKRRKVERSLRWQLEHHGQPHTGAEWWRRTELALKAKLREK